VFSTDGMAPMSPKNEVPGGLARAEFWSRNIVESRKIFYVKTVECAQIQVF